jgi:PEP-CTERM motif-containing protein
MNSEVIRKIILLVLGILLLLITEVSFSTPCKGVEYWNFKDGRQDPIVVNSDNFLGYFIPTANQQFMVGNTLYTFTADPTHPNGARYAAGKHDGIDLIGWVDKDCKIHLFTQDSVQVKPTRTGRITEIKNEKDGAVRVTHSNSSHYDLYGHITPSSSISPGDNAALSTILGTMHSDDPNAFVHLHYGETNVDGDFIDPMLHMKKGCCVTEPSTLLLAGIGFAGVLVFGGRYYREDKHGIIGFMKQIHF